MWHVLGLKTLFPGEIDVAGTSPRRAPVKWEVVSEDSSVHGEGTRPRRSRGRHA